MIQSAKPWMSDIDIPKGAHWPNTLGAELAKSEAGIICATRENQVAPWLLFEAGALARSFRDRSRVCVLLIGIQPVDLSSGPLTLYQAATADEGDLWKLVLSLNDLTVDAKLEKERLRRAFDRSWIDLREQLNLIQVGLQETVEARTDREILEEVLTGVRDLRREITNAYKHHLSQVYIEPSSPEEKKIAEIWSEALGVGRVGIKDNFFDLGGHSLLAARIIARLRREFGVNVSIRDVLETATVEEQAKLIQTLRDAGADGV